MTNKTVPDMKELFRQAAEIAQQVPENMQQAAFNRALDLLVGGSEATSSNDPTQQATLVGALQGNSENQNVDINQLLSQIDSTQHPGVRAADTALDRSLMILQIAWRDHSVDGLTPVEIARILTEKFRIRTTRQAVGMALKDQSDLVDRVAEGRAYRYKIMGPGEEYLENLQQKVPEDEGRGETKSQKSGKAGSRRTAKRATSKKKAKSVAKKSKKNTEKKASQSKQLGPKAAIAMLISEGFFDEPKTGPEVQVHLQKKRGYALGADQLRMAMLRHVRDEALERDENSDGQYEYSRPE